MKLRVLGIQPRSVLPMVVLLMGALSLSLGPACSQSDTNDAGPVRLTEPAAVETAAPTTALPGAVSGAAGEARSPTVDQQQTGAEAQTATVELTANQIVAAHDLVMSEIYGNTVPSIVGLRVTKSVTLGENVPRVMPGDFLSRAAGSGFVWGRQGARRHQSACSHRRRPHRGHAA